MTTRTMAPPSSADRLAAAAGLLGAAGNAAGVAALYEVPAAYRPGTLDTWAAQAALHPGASIASALAFTLGLLLLAGWAGHMRSAAPDPASRAAWAAMALGAVLNAAGCVAPVVLVAHVLPGCGDAAACAPVARALLGLTLSLDALFNLLFGGGLLVVGLSAWRRGEGRALPALGVAAGLATLPVSLQVVSDGAARLLALAGPLWLAYVVAASARSWRGTGAMARTSAP